MASFHLTKEDLKNLRSKEWRLNNLYKITDKDTNLIVFNQNRAQRHYALHAANRNIILKSRQLGFTTFECLDELDDCLWTPNFKALLLSYDDDSALSIFDDKINLAWLHYPFLENFEVDTDRANRLKFGFGDNKFSSIQVKSSGRGSTFNRVHVSEFAKICARYPIRAKEIVTGTFKTVPIDGRIDIESTAEGDTGYFADMFWEAWNRPKDQEKRITEYKAHFYNWQWDDAEIKKIKQADSQIPKEFRDYQRKHNELVKKFPNLYFPIDDIQLTYFFYQWLSYNKDWKKLHQECPTYPEEAFVATGARVFDGEAIDKYDFRVTSGESIGSWVYYEPYKPGHTYALGADVAGGVGKDSSTIAIIDFTPDHPKLVAEYVNNEIEPDIFAYEIRAGGLAYGTCLVAPEINNSMGGACVTKLKEIYPTDMIYKQIRQDRAIDVETEKLGWETNLVTKPKMVYDLVTAIREQLIDIPSKRAVHEMRTFNKKHLQIIREKDDEATAHFDLLMAICIAFQMRNHLIVANAEIEVLTPETRRNVYEAI